MLGTFSAASRGLLPFQDSQVNGCEMTSGCMRRATRVFAREGPLPPTRCKVSRGSKALSTKAMSTQLVSPSLKSSYLCHTTLSGMREWADNRESCVTALSQRNALCFD